MPDASIGARVAVAEQRLNDYYDLLKTSLSLVAGHAVLETKLGGMQEGLNDLREDFDELKTEIAQATKEENVNRWNKRSAVIGLIAAAAAMATMFIGLLALFVHTGSHP